MPLQFNLYNIKKKIIQVGIKLKIILLSLDQIHIRVQHILVANTF